MKEAAKTKRIPYEFVVEKNIPIPPPLNYWEKRGRPRLVPPMVVGDSIKCMTMHQAITVCKALYARGHQPRQRKYANGWRVWRVA